MYQEIQTPILYLNRKNIEQICDSINPVKIVTNALIHHATKQTVLPEESYLGWTNTREEHLRSLNMPSYIGGEFQAAGTKIINANPSNILYGQPRADGVTILFDTETGQIKCIMDGAYISSLRTACITTISIKLFSSEDPSSICVIGAGVQSYMHIKLLTKYFKNIRKVYLFDIDQGRSEKLKEKLSDYSFQVEIMNSAKEAIKSSRVVITLTTVTEGYIKFDWITPGTVIVNVSLDDVLPEVVLNSDKIIVDDWGLVKTDNRRLIGRMYRKGEVIGPSDETKSNAKQIDAELGNVVDKQKNIRENSSEIILVNPFGMSINDISIASQVYKIASQKNIGAMLDR